MPWTAQDAERHKKGLSAKQKRQWAKVANSALQTCLDDGGSQQTCEASAIRQANGTVGNNDARYALHHIQANNYTIRTEMHQGKKHLVVPVIMMVEGVHNGSHGPLLHLAEDLGRFPDAWNGIPISVEHPEEGDHFVSANSPNVIDRQTVGRVYNSQMMDGKLKAEAWIEEEKISQLSPAALGYIRQGRPLDVSVGVFTEDEMIPGVWNSEPYDGIARNHRPDHLALLPGGQGACSWEDGCGIRANEKHKASQSEGGSNSVELLKAMKELNLAGFSAIQINEQGYKEIITALQSKLDRMDDDVKIHFLQEVYDNYCIYEIRSRAEGGGNSLYRRSYQKNSDGSIEFTGEPAAVQRKVEYVTMQKGDLNTMADKDNKARCPKCIEKAGLLIQSKHSTFVEADREWLETLDEPYLDKLLAMQKKDEEPKEPPQVNKEQAIQVLQDELKTPEKFINLLPAEMQDQMRSGLKLHQEKKAELIKTITDHAKDKEGFYTEDDLKAMSMIDLQRLASMIPVKADYSLNANPTIHENEVEPLGFPGVEREEKK